MREFERGTGGAGVVREEGFDWEIQVIQMSCVTV